LLCSGRDFKNNITVFEIYYTGSKDKKGYYLENQQLIRAKELLLKKIKK